jgi:hypothetical protein
MKTGWTIAIAGALLLGITACSSGASGEDAGTDAVAEPGIDAIEAGPDAEADPTPDPTPDVTPDVDDAADATAEAEVGPTCEWPIVVPEDTPDPSRTKFALALFHYNIQYVAGGLSYVDGDGVEQIPLPGCEGWDEAKVEDWIVTQTFEPVVDFYLAHPQWKADIEFGSYLLDVLEARHPQVLDKLRTVSTRGQVELISFHYSAQLFNAFPREDIERSIQLTKDTFKKHCLPLSGSVFDQEGQAGQGRQDVLVKQGYKVGVYPKNLYRHQHGDKPWWPWYKSRGGDMIIAPGGVDPASGIELDWMFLDDGELLAASGKADPYFAPFAQFDPENIKKWEERNQQAEDAGFRVAHVSDYVRHLKARGVAQPDAPPLLEGTWQPQSTRAILRWLGGRGIVWGESEKDNVVRTGNAVARTDLLLAETLSKHAAAQGKDTSEADALLVEGWRHLFFAEVSDASGINPWAGEVLYGIRHNAASREKSAAAIEQLKKALGKPFAAIDSDTGSVTLLDDQPMPEAPEELTDPPFQPTVTADGRTATVKWWKDSKAGAVMEVSLSKAPEGTAGPGEDYRIAEIAIPRTEDVIRYSPALLEGTVEEYAFYQFAWPDGEMFLPLASGLVGLGNGLWVVKDMRSVHLAVRVAPGDASLRFRDETIPPDMAVTWRFGVVKGTAEQALAVARAWNVKPSGIR